MPRISPSIVATRMFPLPTGGSVDPGRAVAALATNWYSGTQISTGDEQSLPNRGSGTDPAVRGSVRGAEITGEALYLPGTADNYFSTPDSAALDITGDIDIRADVSFETMDTSYVMLSKYVAAGNQRGWVFRRPFDDTLELYWSEAGTSIDYTATATATLTSAGVSANDRLKVRVTLDVDNGASDADVKFWTWQDGDSDWVQLGSTVNPGATTQIYANTAPIQIGVRTPSTQPMLGNIYDAEIYDGIDGTLVASPDFAAQVSGTSSFDDDQANTWTLTTTGVDTNDPTFLPHPGGDYVWLPGSTSDYVRDTGVTVPAGSVIGSITRLESGTRGASCSQVVSGTERFYVTPGASTTQVVFGVDPGGAADSDTFSLAGASTAEWLHVQMDYVNDRIRGRLSNTATRVLDSVVWEDWADWVSLGNPALEVAGSCTVVTYGNQNAACGISHSYVQVDDVTVDAASWTADDLSGWTIGRATAPALSTAVVTTPVVVTDGTDDYLALPTSATPTFTPTTGKYTVAILMRSHNDTANTNGRLFSEGSSTSIGMHFFHVTDSGSGDNRLSIRVGGATDFETQLTDVESIPVGDVVMVAAVIDEGDLAGYTDVSGLTSATDITGVGAITHTAPRIGVRSDAVATPYTGQVFAVLDFPGVALTEAQLNDLSAYLKGL